MSCDIVKRHCTSIKLLLVIICGAILLVSFYASNLPTMRNVMTMQTTKPQNLTTQQMKINSSSEICPEKYRGRYSADYPYRYQTWTRENCSFEEDIGQLVTVLVNFQGVKRGEVEIKRLVQGLREAYPSVKMLVGVEKTLNVSIEGIEIVSTGERNAWGDLLKLCKTKYVLLGFDLDYISTWINLHRGIRLLGQGSMAVGGAVRNSTGHWSIPCYQVSLRYYRMEMKEGYSAAVDDCMVCNYAGGPLLVAKEKLKNVKTNLPESIMMLDWSLRTKGEWLACPDIMFHTDTSTGKGAERASMEVWKNFATIWGIQGVVTEWRPRFKEVFNCTEVGMSCDASGQAGSIRLQTWCCHQSWNYILSNLETLAVEHGLEYEISDGTLLGGVKMGNYMPWDIDADLDYNKKQIKSYQERGVFEIWLKKAGIKIEWYNNSNGIWLNLLYQGIKIEMWPNMYENMSRTFTPEHLKHFPTRIQMGKNLWLRAYANPGLAVRGLYGPKVLHHSVSWSLVGLNNSADRYHPGDWKKCEIPDHHACLSNYPTVGNIGLLPNNYP